MFTKLCFPEYDFKFKKEKEKILIFDEIRIKWIVCTPEEWVRQNLLKYLIIELNFPKNFVAIEKSIVLAGRTLRFDALIYNKEFQPFVIIECKAPNVNITQNTFDQILNYNYEVGAKYFLITNGLTLIMGKIDKNKNVVFCKEMLNYETLLIND